LDQNKWIPLDAVMGTKSCPEISTSKRSGERETAHILTRVSFQAICHPNKTVQEDRS
jgi:hypothetical protein